MLINQEQSRYFRVISRVDGFEVGECMNEYYVRHPRGLIDWIHHEVDEAMKSLEEEIPHDVVGRIREVLNRQPKYAQKSCSTKTM